MARISFRLLFTLLLVLPLAACDSDSDGDGDGDGGGNGPNIGSSTVTVTGDVQASYSGSAFFTVDPDDSDVDFGLALFEGAITTAGQGRFVAIGGEGSRPAVGSYPLDTGSSVYGGAYADFTDQTNFRSVVAESGTLTITSSSSDRIAGSISFTGSVVTQSGIGGTASVEATFNAEFVDPDNAPTIPTLQGGAAVE
jgi:hypothetical protein